jgi:hypothetical protein
MNATNGQIRLSDLGKRDMSGRVRLTVYDLWLLCITNIGDPDSLLFQAYNPGIGQWANMEIQFLAEQLNLLALIIWQNGGGKGKKPEPVETPWTKRSFNLLTEGDGKNFKGLKFKEGFDYRESKWYKNNPQFAALAAGEEVPYLPAPTQLPAGYTFDKAGRIHGPNGKFAKDPR